MKITVFTSNQPRHINLINELSLVCDELIAIVEARTIFPGKIKDFYNDSDTMQEYFNLVINAENKVFGKLNFTNSNIKSLIIKSGDLNRIKIKDLDIIFESDIFIIFGSSFIKGDLCKYLISKKAINIHMGLSPFYRGCDCNFWALKDNNPDFVGATIHYLSEGIDSGKILFHAKPSEKIIEPFQLGMEAVRSAHNGIIHHIKNKTLFKLESKSQDKNLQIRLSKKVDFNDSVANDFLNNIYNLSKLSRQRLNLNNDQLTNLFYG